MNEIEVLKNRIKNLEFENTEPRVLINLIEDSIKKGPIFEEKLNYYKNLVSDLKLRCNTQFIFLKSHTKLNNDLIIPNSVGLDGSTINTGIRGIMEYQCCSIAQIYFENFIEKTQDFFDAITFELKSSDPQSQEMEITKNLMYLESENIKRTLEKLQNKNDKYIIFLDGPIVDPPYESDKDYVLFRSNQINEAIDNGIIIVGIVKRFHENAFIQHVVKVAASNCTFTVKDFPSDEILSSILFTQSTEESNSAIYTTTFNPVLNQQSFDEYYKHDIEIKSFLFSLNSQEKIYRVDFPVKIGTNNTQIEEIKEIIVQNLIKWTYIGTSYPYPVLFAHEKCSLKKVVGEVLFQEYLSRTIRTNQNNIRMFKKLGA